MILPRPSSLFRRRPAPTTPEPPAAVPPVPPAGKIAQDVLIAARRHPPSATRSDAWAIPSVPPGLVPPGVPTMANDRELDGLYGWAGTAGGSIDDGLWFPGYAYLAQLTQRAEYRRGSEIVAKEMTRKWLRLVSTGDDDKTATLAVLEKALRRYRVQSIFQKIAELDGFFGRSHIYLDTGASDDILKTPLIVSPATIGRGALKRLVVVEPLWTYPVGYDSRDPLSPNFYTPRSWYVMGKEVHASRLLTFIGREVPDILKPAYLFGGLSLSQIGKPYVDNWIRTRQSVSDLIHSFSVSGLKTNMQATLGGTPDTGLLQRVEFYNNLRDNSGALVLDKDTEEWFNISTPLGTLDKLLAQSQEQMASVWGIPLIVFFGIVPSGLNATSDGELAVWNAWIEAQQVDLFDPNLETLLRILQLSELGAIDEAITHKWEPLGKVDAVGEAAVRKSDAEVAVSYISAGVISPLEERTRLAAEEDSAYGNLDVEDVPEAPADMFGDPEPANDPEPDPEIEGNAA